MNEAVQQLEVQQPVLDLASGGFGRSGYHSVVRGLNSGTHLSIDLIPQNEPNVVGDVETQLPFKTASFATCLAFNILEHTYEVQRVLDEVHRVLRPGSLVHVAVPFLIRVHGDPHDFFRYTHEALVVLLTGAGFRDVEVRPCGAGAFTAGLAQIDFALPRFLRRLALGLCRALDRAVTSRSNAGFRSARDYPIIYVATARS